MPTENVFKCSKNSLNQKGSVQFIVILFLLLGIGVGYYLVNFTTTNLKPKAAGGSLPEDPTMDVSYQVRPVLLIPGWLKSSVNEERVNKYKSDILLVLQDVQQWYAQKLDNHTFQINEKDFLIVYSGPDTIEIPEGSIFGSGYLAEYLDKAGLLKETLSQDLVIWSVGDFSSIGVGYEDGYTITREGRRIDYGPHAYLTQVNLEQLTSTSANRNAALGMLAHEMGHSFGLVYAGWAKGHPCSVISIENCKDGAPTPLPSTDAWNKALMGYESPAFPNLGFNNSIHNPEVWKIYQSPFINPKKDPPPPGTVVPSNVSATSVPSPTSLPTSRPTISFNISPGNRDPISSTDTITITATVNNGNKFDIWIDWKCFVGSFPANPTGTASFNIAQVVDTGRGDLNNNQCNSSVEAPGEHTIHIAPIRDHTLGQSDGATYIVK